MPRPSRNLDRALLAAGRELFPARGCAGMSVREVAEMAGVNLGMFHYHFKTREAFLRAVMQQSYEEMFNRLTLEISASADPLTNLRNALRVLGRFARNNRPFLARLFIDALSGEEVAREFLRDNMPRHIGVLRMFVDAGQKAGLIVAIPFPQVLGLCGGSLVMPIIVGGALVESGALAGPVTGVLQASLLSDAGIDQRIDLALKAISRADPPASKTRAVKTTKKRGKS